MRILSKLELDAFGTRKAFDRVLSKSCRRGSKNHKKQFDSGQFGLFSSQSKEYLIDEALPSEEYTEIELIGMEKRYIGFYSSCNSVAISAFDFSEKFRSILEKLGIDDIGKVYVLAGSISAVKVVITKKHSNLWPSFLYFDETGSIECIFSKKPMLSQKALAR